MRQGLCFMLSRLLLTGTEFYRDISKACKIILRIVCRLQHFPTRHYPGLVEHFPSVVDYYSLRPAAL